MKWMTLKCTAWFLTVSVGCLATSVAAQTKPDFSGRWTNAAAQTENPGRGRQTGTTRGTRGQRGARRGGNRQGGRRQRGGRQRRGDMGSAWGSNLTITQDLEQLVVQYAFFGRGDMQPALRFTYALNGSESRNAVEMGRGVQVQLSKTAWDADKLTITTVHQFPDPITGKSIPYETKQTLSLELPASLVVETTRNGVLGGKASTTRTVYRKQ